MADINNSFDSNVPLKEIKVEIEGPESGTLTENDYSETDNGDGTYTYSAMYSVNSTGDYTLTLTTAKNGIGNGTSEVSSTVTVESVTPDSETWQSYTVGSFPPSPYEELESGGQIVDDTRSYGSSDRSFHVDGDHSISSQEFHPIIRSTFDSRQQKTLEIHYNESSNSQGQTWRWLDTNGNEICAVSADNPEVYVRSGNGWEQLTSSPSPSYNEWRRFKITIDWASNEFDVVWEDLTGSTSDKSFTNLPFTDPASNVSQWEMGNYHHNEYPPNGPNNGNSTECWIGPTTSI